MVVHGVYFVKKNKFPIGSLPEGAIEARDKVNKNQQVDYV